MKMLVLAGGLGSRLKNVVSDVPKPLAPVGAVPFLHYQIKHWVQQGVSSFVFLLHHQADLINLFLDERRHNVLAKCEVESVVEPTLLDTGGAVAYAVKRLNLRGEFMVANADTWLGTGVQELGYAGADSMIVIGQADTIRYGQVDFDSEGFVCAFHEKGKRIGNSWINAGMCMLRADHFKTWNGQRLSLERDIFPKLVAGRRLRAIPVETDFIDIGIPEDYRRFCRWQESGREGKLCS